MRGSVLGRVARHFLLLWLGLAVLPGSIASITGNYVLITLVVNVHESGREWSEREKGREINLVQFLMEFLKSLRNRNQKVAFCVRAYSQLSVITRGRYYPHPTVCISTQLIRAYGPLYHLELAYNGGIRAWPSIWP